MQRIESKSINIYMPNESMPGIGKILLMGQCKPAACFYYSLRPKNVLFPTPHFKGLKKKEKIKICKRDRICPDIYSQALYRKS